MSMKKKVTVLWLDDVREPNRYFSKPNSSLNYQRNRVFYDEYTKLNDINYVWVKNFEEFTDYITRNGLPDLVSFDENLGRGLKTGSECARWLKAYCMEKGLQIPRFYAHSANRYGRDRINMELSEDMKLTSDDLRYMVVEVVDKLFESVYMKNVNNKKKSIGLTYQRGNDYSVGNYNPQDMLKTDKMDQNNEDTYKVRLKCGIDSYNITSIKGSAVMHYFKNKFNHEKTSVNVKDKETGQVDSYQLEMENREYDDFLQQFVGKVNRVVNYAIGKYGSNVSFSGVSIYPVPSSSKFNERMAQEMLRFKLGGLPTQVIDQTLLKKSLTNLKRDEDFIAKNYEYYNGKFSGKETGPLRGTVLNHVDKTINQYNQMEKIGEYIDVYNERLRELLDKLRNCNSRNGQIGSRAIMAMVTNYKRLYITLRYIYKITEYENPVSVNGKSRMDFETYANRLKYSKGPSTDNRSNLIWQMVSPYLKGQKCPVDNMPYKKIDLVYFERAPFKMKSLSNGERMGMMDYFAYNDDQQLVQQEINKIKGTILVVFDDNISGGATLSDICYQLQKKGIQYIIPITFGEMAQKWQINFVPLNEPYDREGNKGKFNY